MGLELGWSKHTKNKVSCPNWVNFIVKKEKRFFSLIFSFFLNKLKNDTIFVNLAYTDISCTYAILILHFIIHPASYHHIRFGISAVYTLETACVQYLNKPQSWLS